MKVRATVFLFLFLVLRSWAQTSVSVPVVDKSELGSPLQITGNITFIDQITGNSIISSSDYELKARNVSGKGIIFLLVHFTEMGPREGGIGHRIQWDNFFRDEELGPGTVFLLDRSSGGRLIGYFNPLSPSRDPVGEVRVVYAEFSDGSVYGERREAKDILVARSVIVGALQRLDKANDDRSFLQTLARKLEPEEADGFLKSVLKRYEMSGLVTAVKAESKKISVYNEDIPGFLKPRDMEYEVRVQTTLSNIKVGDTIHATLLSDNEEVWVLEDPVVTGHP